MHIWVKLLTNSVGRTKVEPSFQNIQLCKKLKVQVIRTQSILRKFVFKMILRNQPESSEEDSKMKHYEGNKNDIGFNDLMIL